MISNQALDILKTGRNCLLTGPAGSGKTYLLDLYIKYLKKNGIPVAVTASTGIAATHLGGQTIHSWSGIGINETINQYYLEKLESKPHFWKRLDKVKVLIIDEISMLHHWQLDLVDQVLKHFKRNDEPFGGVQVILCGDFFQLPPVTNQKGSTQFAYRAQVWPQANFSVCYLETQYRQANDELLDVLTAIRSGQVSQQIKNKLESRIGAKLISGVKPTRLHTHNVNVDKINQQELDNLPGPDTSYDVVTKGKSFLVEQLLKSCLAPAELILKPKAKVMFVKNNLEIGYANGTLGEVISCGSEPVIRLLDGRQVTVTPATWTIEEEGKIKAEISQIPLRLAWAMTIHKSQGMSLEAADIDLSQAFERGMGYVALSRVRKLSGLVLQGLNDTALAVNREARQADSRLKELSIKFKKEFEGLPSVTVSSQIKNFITKNGGQVMAEKVSTYDKTKEFIEKKIALNQIAKERNLSGETILHHLEKIVADDSNINISYLKKVIKPMKLKRIMAVLKEFDRGQEILLAPVKNRLPADVSFNDIRLARIFYYQEK